MKSSWRCVIVLFSILAAPLYGHAVTLQDLTIPGASFTASPATYTDFQILFSRTFGTTPLSLADVNITPFGAGFVLSPSFSAIGKAEDIDLHMHFTVHSASITGFGVGGTVIAGGGGGGTLFARDDIGDTAGGSVSTTEFQQATFFPISQFDVIAPTSILHVDFFVGADNLPCSPEHCLTETSSVDAAFGLAAVPEGDTAWLLTVMLLLLSCSRVPKTPAIGGLMLWRLRTAAQRRP